MTITQWIPQLYCEIQSNELDDQHYSWADMTFILDICRLYHTGKLRKKHSAITVNVRSSIKTIILVLFKVPGKKTLRIWPHSLGNCLLLDPLIPLEFLMPSVGGSINRILVWRVTVSIFLWTYPGIHVIATGVTASFSLNFLNSFNIVVKCTYIFCWH